MRKIISSFITAALLLTILFSGYGISSASYELRFTTMPHSPHIWIDVMEEFSERVKQETDGEVNVSLYTGGRLGTDEAIFDDMEIGVVDMNVGTAANATTIIPELQLFSFNYLFTELDQLKAAVDPDGEIFASFADIVEERQPHLKLMPFMGGGTRNLNTTFGAVEKPEDLEGYTMRVMESPIEDAMWSELGVVTTTIPFTELYTAVQTGVADAFEVSTVGYLGNSLYEVAEYHNRTAHEFMVGVWFVNRNSFEELPSEYQDIIMETAEELARDSIDKGLEQEQDILEELRENDVIINHDVDSEAFSEILEPLHEEFAETIEATEILNLIQELDY